MELPTHTYTEVIEFDTEDELIGWIEEARLFNKKKYRVIKCLPIKVHSSLDIKVKLDAPAFEN